jgi:hypothetical protein
MLERKELERINEKTDRVKRDIDENRSEMQRLGGAEVVGLEGLRRKLEELRRSNAGVREILREMENKRTKAKDKAEDRGLGRARTIRETEEWIELMYLKDKLAKEKLHDNKVMREVQKLIEIYGGSMFYISPEATKSKQNQQPIILLEKNKNPRMDGVVGKLARADVLEVRKIYEIGLPNYYAPINPDAGLERQVLGLGAGNALRVASPKTRAKIDRIRFDEDVEVNIISNKYGRSGTPKHMSRLKSGNIFATEKSPSNKNLKSQYTTKSKSRTRASKGNPSIGYYETNTRTPSLTHKKKGSQGRRSRSRKSPGRNSRRHSRSPYSKSRKSKTSYSSEDKISRSPSRLSRKKHNRSPYAVRRRSQRKSRSPTRSLSRPSRQSSNRRKRSEAKNARSVTPMRHKYDEEPHRLIDELRNRDLDGAEYKSNNKSAKSAVRASQVKKLDEELKKKERLLKARERELREKDKEIERLKHLELKEREIRREEERLRRHQARLDAEERELEEQRMAEKAHTEKKSRKNTPRRRHEGTSVKKRVSDDEDPIQGLLKLQQSSIEHVADLEKTTDFPRLDNLLKDDRPSGKKSSDRNRTPSKDKKAAHFKDSLLDRVEEGTDSKEHAKRIKLSDRYKEDKYVDKKDDRGRSSRNPEGKSSNKNGSKGDKTLPGMPKSSRLKQVLSNQDKEDRSSDEEIRRLLKKKEQNRRSRRDGSSKSEMKRREGERNDERSSTPIRKPTHIDGRKLEESKETDKKDKERKIAHQENSKDKIIKHKDSRNHHHHTSDSDSEQIIISNKERHKPSTTQGKDDAGRRRFSKEAAATGANLLATGRGIAASTPITVSILQPGSPSPSNAKRMSKTSVRRMSIIDDQPVDVQKLLTEVVDAAKRSKRNSKVSAQEHSDDDDSSYEREKERERLEREKRDKERLAAKEKKREEKERAKAAEEAKKVGADKVQGGKDEPGRKESYPSVLDGLENDPDEMATGNGSKKDDAAVKKSQETNTLQVKTHPEDQKNARKSTSSKQDEQPDLVSANQNKPRASVARSSIKDSRKGVNDDDDLMHTVEASERGKPESVKPEPPVVEPPKPEPVKPEPDQKISSLKSNPFLKNQPAKPPEALSPPKKDTSPPPKPEPVQKPEPKLEPVQEPTPQPPANPAPVTPAEPKKWAPPKNTGLFKPKTPTGEENNATTPKAATPGATADSGAPKPVFKPFAKPGTTPTAGGAAPTEAKPIFKPFAKPVPGSTSPTPGTAEKPAGTSPAPTTAANPPKPVFKPPPAPPAKNNSESVISSDDDAMILQTMVKTKEAPTVPGVQAKGASSGTAGAKPPTPAPASTSEPPKAAVTPGAVKNNPFLKREDSLQSSGAQKAGEAPKATIKDNPFLKSTQGANASGKDSGPPTPSNGFSPLQSKMKDNPFLKKDEEAKKAEEEKKKKEADAAKHQVIGALKSLWK